MMAEASDVYGILYQNLVLDFLIYRLDREFIRHNQ